MYNIEIAFDHLLASGVTRGVRAWPGMVEVVELGFGRSAFL